MAYNQPPPANGHWPDVALHGTHLYVPVPPLTRGAASSSALVQAGLPADIFTAAPARAGRLQPALMAPCPLADACGVLHPEGECRGLGRHLATHHAPWWDTHVAGHTAVRCPVPRCGAAIAASRRRPLASAVAEHVAAHTLVPGKPYVSCLFAGCMAQYRSADSLRRHISMVHRCVVELCTDAEGQPWMYHIKPL